ncbi:MAG: hypothetical protein PHS23_08980 [Candidatus Cloacimonetes bacterium]|nr:hypothetical protein [Candidatus Cloacimonadota bacterium]
MVELMMILGLIRKYFGAAESSVSAPVRIAYQIGESPIQGTVKPCS